MVAPGRRSLQERLAGRVAGLRLLVSKHAVAFLEEGCTKLHNSVDNLEK